MAFLIKPAFFILFGFNCLLCVFCIFIFIKLLIDPHQPLSEVITMLIGGCIIAAGVYLSYQNGYLATDYKNGAITLGKSLLIAIVWVLARMFIFKPLNW